LASAWFGRLTDAKEKYDLSKAEFAQLEKLVDMNRVLEALKADKDNKT